MRPSAGSPGCAWSCTPRSSGWRPTGLAAFGRGDLLTRLVADVDSALDLPLRVILPWAQAILVAAATVGFLAWLLPVAGVMVGVLSVVAVAVTPWLIARLARSAEERMAPAKAELSSAVVRALDATSEITAFGAGPAAAARIHDLDDDLTRLSARESFALGFGGGIGVLVQGAAVAAALVIAVPAVTSGQIEPVMLAVVALLPLALFDVLSGLPSSALAYQRLRGSAVRIQEVETAPTPVPAPAVPVPVPDGFTGLNVRGRHRALDRGGSGDRGHRPRGRTGAAGRSGRSERLGQVDARERAHGLPAVHGVGAPVRRGGA